MVRRLLFCTCAIVLCHAGGATANVLSGVFSGTTVNSAYDNLPLGRNFDGVSITGSFDIEPTVITGTVLASGATTTLLAGTGQLQFNIPAIGLFNQGEPLALIAESDVMGVETLTAEFTHSLALPYDVGELVFTGTGLFDPANPLVLSPGMIDNALSGGSAYERFDYFTDIQFDSVTFDTPVAVREPSTISLLALWSSGVMLFRNLPHAIGRLGVGLTAAGRWLRSQRRGHQLTA